MVETGQAEVEGGDGVEEQGTAAAAAAAVGVGGGGAAPSASSSNGMDDPSSSSSPFGSSLTPRSALSHLAPFFDLGSFQGAELVRVVRLC